MREMRKRVLFIPALLMLVLLCMCIIPSGTVMAAQISSSTDYVVDGADILTDDQEQELYSRAEEIADTYSCAVYIITMPEYTEYGYDIFDVADATYIQSGLGYGADRNGVLLLMSMNDRQYATYFYGPVADNAFDSYGQEKMEDEFLGDFGDDRWMDGFTHFQEVCQDYLQRAADGHPVRESPVGGLAVCAVISVIVALIVCQILKSKSKSVRRGTRASHYVSGELNLTGQRERFDYVTETRVPIVKNDDSSGGGGSHTSSSGGSGRSGGF